MYAGSCAYCDAAFETRDSRGQRFCNKSCARLYRRAPPTCRLTIKACRKCVRTFVARPAAEAYCSDGCRPTNSEQAVRVMALYRLATSSLDIAKASMWRARFCEYLVERDGDRCGICKGKVDLGLPSGPRGDERGPSIDHVVPRSQGGSDELANLRLTHWKCNRERSNRGGGEQLRLVG